MKPSFKIFIGIALLSLALVGGDVVVDSLQAQTIRFTDNPCPEGGCLAPPPSDQVDPITNPDRTFREQVLVIVNYFLGFTGLAAVVAILYGAFLWIFSGGDDENIGKGRKIVLWAGAGIILILMSYTIVRFFTQAASQIGEDPPDPSQGNTPPVVIVDDTGNPVVGDSFPPGTTNSGGTITSPNGTPYPVQVVVNPDGTVTILDEDGNPISPDATFNTDGTVTLPDGTVLNPDVSTAPQITTIITGGPVSGQAPLTVELSGLSSRYPGEDQTIPDSAFGWSYVDRNGQTIDLGDGHTIVHTLEQSGRFVFTLTIDSREEGPEVAQGRATFSVEVASAGPEVNFTIDGNDARLFQQFSLAEGANGLSFVPLVQNLDGLVIEEYEWNFGDGTPLLRSDTNENVTHIFSQNGDFSVSLNITDNLGRTYARNVRISIADVVSRMQITPEQKVVGQNISFSSNTSNSSFGNIIETVWILINADGEREEVRDASFSRVFSQSGNVQVTLTVRDTSGNTAVDSRTISIASNPPSASMSVSAKSTSEPSVFVFDAGLSSDRDGDRLRYSWDFYNDGTFEIVDSDSSVAEFTFSDLGTHAVKLRVTDENGQTDEVTDRVTVDSLLNVGFTADRFVAHPDQSITFLAESEQAVTYFWDFGDGSTDQGSEESVRHQFREEGKYSVTLTVFDQNDQENEVSKTIYIGERDMPVAVIEVEKNGILQRLNANQCGAGRDGIAVSRSDMMTFDASSSINRDGESRPGGSGSSKLDYEWEFPDGSRYRERSVRRRFSEFTSDECFPVRLTVRDQDSGKRDQSDPVWVQITNAPPQMDSLQISLPDNTTTPVIVPISVVGARDPEGASLQYKWWAYREGSRERIGLHTTSAPSTSVILPVFGLGEQTNRYYFVVEISDNLGATINSEALFGKSDFVDATNGENRSPVVDFRMEKTSIDEGDTNTFFADASDPLGGSFPDSAYMWDFNGDNVFDVVGAGPQVSYRFEKPGEYPVRLKVVYRGLSSSQTRSVFVARRHEVPRAAFTYSLRGRNVIFDASNSEVDTTVPGNSPSYIWDFDLNVDSDGDGNPENDEDAITAREENAYSSFGTRPVKLTVIDRLGVKDEVIRDVPVSASGQIATPGTGSDPAHAAAGGGSHGVMSTIALTSTHPMTTLDLVLAQRSIRVGEQTDLLMFVKNANNTLFEGNLEIRILSGEATLGSNRVNAVLGESSTLVTATSAGRVVLEVTARNTISGDITEVIPLVVQP